MNKKYTVLDELSKKQLLLHDSLLNKGTAFSQKERDAFGLNGLLPPRILSIEDQKKRILMNFYSKPNDIEKYTYLMGLQDRNETLFYRTFIHQQSGKHARNLGIYFVVLVGYIFLMKIVVILYLF